MNAVIYTRVSTDEQAQFGASLTAQEKSCEDYASSNSMKVVKRFVEPGKSAKSTQRPVFQQMLDFCASNPGSVDCVIVWKMDRFSRVAMDHLVISARLKAIGVRVLSVTEYIEDTPMGKAVETIIAVMAEMENQTRADRVVLGMTERLSQGGWPHHAPIGYKNAKDFAGRPSLVPSDRAEIVKEIFQRFSTGESSITELAAWAGSMGLRSKTGKPIYRQTITKILHNPIYAGVIKSPLLENNSEGLHEPLISMQTFNLAQSRLSSSQDRLAGRVESWPLRGGFVICSRCSLPLTGGAPRSRNGSHVPRYQCRKCTKKSVGVSTSIKAESFHALFSDFLRGIELKESELSCFKDTVLRSWQEATKSARASKGKLSQALGIVKEKKSKLLDLYIDGKISEVDKNMKLAECDVELLKIEHEVESLDGLGTASEELVGYSAYFLSNLAKIWIDGDLHAKNALQSIIFPHGVEYEFGGGFRTAQLGSVFRYKDLNNMGNMLENNNLVNHVLAISNRMSFLDYKGLTIA